MPLSNLFFYKMLFIAELLVAEFLFTFHLKKKPYFALRFAGCAVLLFLLAAFFPVPAPTFWYISLMFLTLFAVTVPLLRLCCDEPLRNVFFCAMASYTCQHFAYELANLMMSIFVLGRSPILGMYENSGVDFRAFDKQALFFVLLYLMCYVVSYWLLYAVFGRRIRKGADMKIKSVALVLLVGAGLLVNIFISSLLTYNDSDFISALANYATSLLCCLLLLYCQFGQLLTKEMRYELEFVRGLWHQEKEQYALSKENIDLINLKCHDMRHQIHEIGKSKSIASETIREIEDSISFYDTMVKTGNEVLDIILTEKSLRCYKNGILFTCVADGALLDFMNATDLYSLFGNALDNAIEAVLKIEAGEGRIIGLKIRAIGELITINVKNSFAGAVSLDEHGYPVTTKADSDYHGFGFKSMAYIVDKYDGNLAVDAKDGFFDLDIMLPVPEPEQT